MNSRLLLAFILQFFCGSAAFGGAWGIGSFENDDASDWVWELEESSGPTVIDSALRNVAMSSGYIDAPSASCAIAAAEVLAAMIDKPSASIPDEVANWVEGQSFEPSTALLDMARVALANVLDENRSELAQLWSETGPDYENWKKTVAALTEKLQ